ncbi:hypothetical protein N7475_008629 [Penicillium sp. IBT 31633x]|nr:hypothetical protein N7475_008629 [Penicillium sp. IBT 31633x]
MHPTVRYCIIHTTDARAAYKIIRSIFTIEYHGSGFYEYLELTYIKHTCSGAQDFLDKWRATLSKLKSAIPSRLLPAFIFYRFLTAVMQEKDGVGALPLPCVPLTPEDFTKRALDSTLERFVAFENDFFNVDNDLELQDY